MIKIASELIMFKIMDKIVNITASAREKRNNKLRWQEQKIKYGNVNIGINRSYWNCNFDNNEFQKS